MDPRKELIELIEWTAARWPRYSVKLEALLEKAREEDFSDFGGSFHEAEKHYALEANLIIDPPDPDDKSGSDWADFI